MLALSTTDALTIVDPTIFRNAPSSVTHSQSLSSQPTATVWSQDNTAFFAALSDTIHEYTPSGTPVKELYTGEDRIASLIAKDKGHTLIFGASNKIHVLENTGKIAQTFASHKTTITSLSLSNDCSLLASTSSSAVHVHNLTLGSHTVLRGLPPSAGQITTCIFHPHSRTRLIVGVDKQVLIYDTTKPSSPLKAVPLSDASSGGVVAIACSPFSKTLVAVATSGGHVGLLDMDKDKGLFRTLNLKMPLTSASFSPEGAALYFGTENGKLLIVDLRMLDKAPKCINISEDGCRVECMSFQKKIKSTVESKAKLGSPTLAKVEPARRPSATKAAPSPTRTRAKAGTSAAVTGTPAKPVVRKASATASVTTGRAEKAAAPKAAEKRVFSPVRDPLGNSLGPADISVTIDTLGALKKRTAKSSTSPSELNSQNERRSSSRISTTRSSSSLGVSDARARPTSRTGSISSARRAALKPSSASAARPDSRAESSISRSDSPDLPTPYVLSAFSEKASNKDRRSRTPSPELPAVADPTTPVATKRAGLGVLGMGTPEVERWIEAGKGKAKGDEPRGNGRHVGFKEASEDEASDDDADDANGKDTQQRDLSMQISPRRAPPSWAQAPMPSPLRTLASGNSPSSPGSSAHNILRNIMADVMYDYQRETKAEMTGLHLDLVRMGRGLRKELREVAEGGVSGLAELERLREENRLLKAENERLRRGY